MKIIVLTRRRLAVFLSIFAFGILSFGIAAKGVSVAASSSGRLLPIYSVKTDEKKACLTFDAAWGNSDTEELIKILGKYNVKATFFVVGDWVNKYPESVKALNDAGHSIQNHSDTHPHMSKLDREKSAEEIINCNKKIEAITGKAPTLLRPPYGDYNNSVIEAVRSQKMQTIQWDVDSLDWKNPTPQEISKRVLSNVQNGSIILFHNDAKNTPAALPEIIEALQKQGYTLVTVNDLIYPDSSPIDPNGQQHKN